MGTANKRINIERISSGFRPLHYNSMSLARMSGKAFCAKCFQGTMILLKERAEDHGFFQCSHCGKIDELSILKTTDGSSSTPPLVRSFSAFCPPPSGPIALR